MHKTQDSAAAKSDSDATCPGPSSSSASVFKSPTEAAEPGPSECDETAPTRRSIGTMTVESKKTDKKWSRFRYTRGYVTGPTGVGIGSGSEKEANGGRLGPCKLACAFGLILLGAAFITGTVLLWFTNFFENVVHQGMAFSQDGTTVEKWRNPSLRPLVRLHVYNYTNTLEYFDGVDAKLRVQEVGPYVYRETIERLNIKFNDNGTLSYNERRSHVFLPEMSNGAEDDIVMVPNLPLIGVVSKAKGLSMVSQFMFNTIIHMTEASAFTPLRARDFFFGYNNSLYSVTKQLSSLIGNAPFPKLGLLSTRSGLNKDIYTIWTGQDDFNQIDKVSRHNGRTAMTAWEDSECNRIDGSEGAFFPVDALKKRQPVFLFNGGLCRRIELHFKSEVSVMEGIPALRYGPPENFFDNPADNPDNACYQHSLNFDYLPSGVFNNSPCSFGSPTFLSFPHFYLGDPKLREFVDGITPPVKEKHEMIFNIHPELGMNLGAVSRLQINIMIRKADYMSHLNPMKDGMIIPIAWIETKADEFPEESQRVMYHATFTLRAVQRGMMYAFPILSVLVVLLLAYLILPCVQRPADDVPLQVFKLTKE